MKTVYSVALGLLLVGLNVSSHSYTSYVDCKQKQRNLNRAQKNSFSAADINQECREQERNELRSKLIR